MLTGVEWRHLLIRVEYFSAIISIIINIFLVHLILNKSPKSFGAYKYLMLYFSLFEIFYGVLTGLACPFHHTQQGTYVSVVSTKDHVLTKSQLEVVNGMYWWCYGVSNGLYGIHFVYRYLASCGSPLVATFNSWRIHIWLLIPVLSGTIWVANIYIMFVPSQFMTDFLRIGVLEAFGLKGDEFIYIGLQIYEKTKEGGYKFNWKHIIGSSINETTVTLSFFTIFYYGIKCYRCIQKMASKSRSSRTHALQKQLFYALVIQTLIPTILIQMSLTSILTLCMFNIHDELINGSVSIAISIYPVIDPLPNIFIIRDYRQATFHYLNRLRHWILCKEPPETSETVVSFTQSASVGPNSVVPRASAYAA